MIFEKECGLNFLTFVLQLRKPAKNLNQEINPNGSTAQTHWMSDRVNFLVEVFPGFSSTMRQMVHRCGASGSMRACHAAGPGSIPGRDRFPGWGFFQGFSSPVRQMSGNFRPTSSPNIICSPSSSFYIRLVGMNGCVLGVYCLSCLCCLGGGPGIVLITHPGEALHVIVWSKSMYVIHSLIPSPDRSWLCKARAAWVT